MANGPPGWAKVTITLISMTRRRIFMSFSLKGPYRENVPLVSEFRTFSSL